MSWTVFTTAPVAVAICFNAAVWDAIATVLYSRAYTLNGVSSAIMSAAFQCLALNGVQPHLLAVSNGAGVFIALIIANKGTGSPLSPAQKTAAGLMVAGGVTGLAGISPPDSTAKLSSDKLVTFVLAAYALSAACAAIPSVTWVRDGSNILRQLSRKWLFPAADAINASAFTACLMLASVAAEPWALGFLPIAGSLTLASSVASLRINTVADHVCICYIGWCVGLLILDLIGGYRFNAVLVVVQMACFAIALLLILKDPQKEASSR